MRIHFFTAPFYFAFIWFKVQGSRGGFAANIPMTIHAAPFFSLLPLEGGAPKGRRLAACNGTPSFGEPTPPRFARLPLPEEGARMIFKETRIQSLSFAVEHSRFPHICRAPLRFPHLSFIPSVPYPPLRGTFP